MPRRFTAALAATRAVTSEAVHFLVDLRAAGPRFSGSSDDLDRGVRPVGALEVRGGHLRDRVVRRHGLGARRRDSRALAVALATRDPHPGTARSAPVPSGRAGVARRAAAAATSAIPRHILLLCIAMTPVWTLRIAGPRADRPRFEVWNYPTASGPSRLPGRGRRPAARRQRDEAGEQDRRVELSRERFRDGQRARHGVNGRHVAVAHGGQRDEAEVDEVGLSGPPKPAKEKAPAARRATSS